MADFLSPSPPLRFPSLNVVLGLLGGLNHVAFSLAVLGRALLALFCFCVFSGRGGRFPVEPWTGLHCSELYWRCPGRASCSSVWSARVQQSLPTWFGALMGRSDSANGSL